MQSSLCDKTLVMLVSPSAVGKSSVMNQVVNRDKRFSRVRSFTSRAPRANDEPNQYFYHTSEEIATLRSRGEIVSEVTFPTASDIYGTTLASYNGEFCLLDTLANSVETYRRLPFKRTITISLTAPAEVWRQRFLNRYPSRTLQAEKRLEEAVLSIKWSLKDTQTRWLVNDGSLETIAATLLQMVNDDSSDSAGKAMAHAILERIESETIWT